MRFYRSFFKQEKEQPAFLAPSQSQPNLKNKPEPKGAFPMKMVKTFHNQFRRKSSASHLDFLYKKNK
jgi:hypothetical protein